MLRCCGIRIRKAPAAFGLRGPSGPHGAGGALDGHISAAHIRLIAAATPVTAGVMIYSRFPGDHGTDGADRCVDLFGFRVVFLGLQVIKTGGQDQDTDDGQRDGGEVLPDADGGDEGQGYQHVGLDVEGGDEANDGLQYEQIWEIVRRWYAW